MPAFAGVRAFRLGLRASEYGQHVPLLPEADRPAPGTGVEPVCRHEHVASGPDIPAHCSQVTRLPLQSTWRYAGLNAGAVALQESAQTGRPVCYCCSTASTRRANAAVLVSHHSLQEKRSESQSCLTAGTPACLFFASFTGRVLGKVKPCLCRLVLVSLSDWQSHLESR